MMEVPGGVRPRWMSDRHWNRVVRTAEKVRRLTGARVWIDKIQRQFCVGYRRHSGRMDLIGGCDFKLFKGNDPAAPCFFDPATDNICAEDIIHLVRLARISPALKDRWRREIEDRRASEEENDWQQMFEDRRPELLDQMRFNRERRGMHARYRPSAVVNGFGGAA